jgi:DNA-binding GntR family transcriptional regulator
MNEALLRPVAITRSSTVDQLVIALRERILRGELAAGARLREAAVSEASGVSRNTVREALLVLAGEGLVRHEPHRGATVTALSAEDIHDLYEVRRVLESAAIDAATTHGSPDLAPVDAALDRLAAAAAVGEWLGLVDADLLFHGCLVDLHCSTRISRSFRAIQGELRLGFAIVAYVDQEFVRPQGIVDEHRRLLELLRANDAHACKTLLATHLVHYRDRLIEVVVSGSLPQHAAH